MTLWPLCASSFRQKLCLFSLMHQSLSRTPSIYYHARIGCHTINVPYMLLKTYCTHIDSKEVGKSNKVSSDESCIQFYGNWTGESTEIMAKSMSISEDFISEEEEECIMSEIGNYLKRMRYEFDHWDDAIHGFRETERLRWNDANERVLERVRRRAFSAGTLRHVHVLDLAAAGVIKPHVDSVRFCGSTIAGLSLLSDAVMRLVNTAEPHRRLDALLPRRSLYVMRDTARYDFTHEILAADASQFRGRPVPRYRRVSIICRSEPADTPTGQTAVDGPTGQTAANGGPTGRTAAEGEPTGQTPADRLAQHTAANGLTQQTAADEPAAADAPVVR